MITRKCSQYGISLSAKTTVGPPGPSVITLARLSQSFLAASAAIILAHGIAENLKSKLFPGITLLLLMTHTIFPGLIRERDLDLIEIARYLNLEMSIMLSTPKEKRRLEFQTMADLLEKSETFVMAAVHGTIVSDNVKEVVLRRGGLLCDSGPSVEVQSMSAIASRLYSLRESTHIDAARRINITVSPNL